MNKQTCCLKCKHSLDYAMPYCDDKDCPCHTPAVNKQMEEWKEEFVNKFGAFIYGTDAVIAGRRMRNMADWWIAKLHSQRGQDAREIEDYLEHKSDCILSYFEAGEPLANGGYRQKYKGKWYQTKPMDETPKCDCGLADILTILRNKK